MHCEGCAKKVKKCLKGVEGVEEVKTDCTTHLVVVKGDNADPLMILEKIQRKSHKKVELLKIPKPKTVVKKEEKMEEKKKEIKPEVKKEEPVIIVVLKVHMHCEACAEEIQKRIVKMKGVDSSHPDLKNSQVIVKGVFDPHKLVEFVYRKTGKHAAIAKVESNQKEKPKEDKKRTKNPKIKKAVDTNPNAEEEEGKRSELKNEYLYFYPESSYPPKSYMENVYSSQMFSDDNPNACSVM